CISDFSTENLTFVIITRKGPFEVDQHLISSLMDILIIDESIPIHTLVDKPSKSEKRVLTRALCNINAQ
ncbi:hypothetical protein PJP10_32105, partial [Mycobacterium kansasii]